MRNNSYAPLVVKKKVLNTCLTAVILYGCETWSSTSLHKLETLYRKAVKITFSVRKSAPSEVVYIETGFNELKAEIYKRQHKFWSKILSNIESDSHNSISKIYKAAVDKNTHFLRHYIKLHT